MAMLNIQMVLTEIRKMPFAPSHLSAMLFEDLSETTWLVSGVGTKLCYK